MNFEQTWRWFGSYDTIPLADISQTGAKGIVTALHEIPTGEVWPVAAIETVKKQIEEAGLQWSVVESIPVHEDIKKQTGNAAIYIENYKQSIKNVGACGIDTICYNFMPLTDWTRTSLNSPLNSGGTTLRFDATAFAAFELFILKRDGAKDQYSKDQQQKAHQYYTTLTSDEIEELTETILLGLPGDEEMTLTKFRDHLTTYHNIDRETLRSNLQEFLHEIIPVAEDSGVRMAIHPDDPPFSLFGLPRIVSTRADIRAILNTVNSPTNGITFCTGSLGAHPKNNLQKMVREFGHRINFVHLRSVQREDDGSFEEVRHLECDAQMYDVMLELITEQQHRVDQGRSDLRMPFRPDHGQKILDDQNKVSYPGYSGLGRMRGLAELRGLEMGIRQSLARSNK